MRRPVPKGAGCDGSCCARSSARVLVAVAGYAAADVLDVAPGILTLDRPGRRADPHGVRHPGPGAAARARRRRATRSSPTRRGAPAPRRAPGWPRPDHGIRRPGAEGGHRHRRPRRRHRRGAVRPGRGRPPRVPASTRKLLAAIAVANSLDIDDRMPTTVVRGRRLPDLVLVVGGDTLLAQGAGDPDGGRGSRRAGRPRQPGRGLAAPPGRTTVRLRLDVTYAPGPRYPPGWNPARRARRLHRRCR